MATQRKASSVPKSKLKGADTSAKFIEPSVGQQLCGVSLKSSGDPAVDHVRDLFAAIADTLLDNMNGKSTNKLNEVMLDRAMTDILSAQMMVVKVLTFKPYVECQEKSETK